MPEASTGASGPPELTVSGWRGLVREQQQEGSGPRWGQLGSKQPRPRACDAAATSASSPAGPQGTGLHHVHAKQATEGRAPDSGHCSGDPGTPHCCQRDGGTWASSTTGTLSLVSPTGTPTLSLPSVYN